MKYYKNVCGDYLISISTVCGDTEISTEEYERLMEIISNRPADAPEGYQYRLNASTLEWDLAELPPVEDTDATIEDWESEMGRLGI